MEDLNFKDYLIYTIFVLIAVVLGIIIGELTKYV